MTLDGPTADLHARLETLSDLIAGVGSGYEDSLEVALRATSTLFGGATLSWVTDGERLAFHRAYDADFATSALLGRALAGTSCAAADGPFAELAASPVATVIEDVGWDVLGAPGRDAASALVRTLGPTTLSLVSLPSHGVISGALGLVRPAAESELPADESALFRELGERVGLALENARLGEAVQEATAARESAEAALRAGEATISIVADSAARRQAALVEHASDMILVLTLDGKLQYVNPALERTLGYSWRAGDIVDVLATIHPDDRERCLAHIRASPSHKGIQPLIEFRMARSDGDWRYVRSIGNNLLDDPAVAGFVVTFRDITEEREIEARLRANALRQAALAELGRWALAGLGYQNLLEDAVRVLSDHLSADLVHVFESYPDASLLTLSASKGQIVADAELMSGDPTSSPASYALVTQEAVVSEDLGSEARFEVPTLWRRAGAVSIVETPIPGSDTPVGVVGIGSRTPRKWTDEDINFVKAVANVLAAAAARTRADQAIRAQALQDPLTGLPNRLLLSDHAARSAAPRGTHLQLDVGARTVFVLDIDRFKEINDTLGHGIGDLVLIEVARRLGAIGAPIKLVARLGGDEFAIVVADRLTNEGEAELGARLLTSLGDSLDVGGVSLRLRGSVGVAGAHAHLGGREVAISTLVRQAEVAMYQAKSDHVGLRRYTEDLERSSLSRLALANELVEAIDGGQLRLDYQPKVSTADDRVAGVEALVRWQHPSRGLLLPDVFVPLAEQTGIIRELTNWVLARALAECAAWHRAGWRIPVAVNLSAGTMHDPLLLEAVMASIGRSGIPPQSVELEITESAVMHDPEGALRSLKMLTREGVRIALDDFGTGYSSLAYLQRLPVHSVKIDKSFVTPLEHDPRAQAIVRAVVDLAHSLHLSVVAEGVDSAAVLAVAHGLGCDAIQGFYIATPMDATALQRWIAEIGITEARTPVTPA